MDTHWNAGKQNLHRGDHGGQSVEKTITVTVIQLDVTDIADITDITVANGTDKSDIGLPTEAGITLNDGSIQTVNVTWDNGNPAYDKFVAGYYTFTGTLDLPSGVVNTNDVKVTVTVASQQLSIPLGVKTEVFAGKVGTIEGTDTQITFPHDLPSGTFVTITDVSGEGFVTNAEGIERAGDVLDFEFEYPSGQNFTSSFWLTMSYGNGFSTAIDIYYYNEHDGQWETQNGTNDTSNHTMTINPDHFSTYGVFAKAADSKTPERDSQDPETVEDPKEDGDDAPTIAEDDAKSETATGNLPNTATPYFAYLFIGLTMILIGISLYWYRRRNRTV